MSTTKWHKRLRNFFLHDSSSSSAAIEMADDTESGFEQISGSVEAIVDQMIVIQNHRVSRKNIEEWATHLRFLRIPDDFGLPVGGDDRSPSQEASSSKRRAQRKILHLTERNDNVNEQSYVAVSYCWSSAKDQRNNEESDKSGVEYFIKTKSGIRRSKVNTSVLNRVVRFAMSKGLRYIWIDQECINQDDQDDQEVGIQSMDQVYRRSSHPLGLLDEFINPKSLGSLCDLLNGNIDKILADILTTNILIEVLRTINRNSWYTRAWIYQEEYCASDRLVLLAPSARITTEDQKLFMRGGTEIEIPGKRLREATWDFCSAWSGTVRGNIDHVAAEFAFDVGSDSECARMGWPTQWRFQQFPHRVLRELEYRGIQFASDMLAIVANCCDYDTRLNSALLATKGYGFSICALTLILLNGHCPSYAYNTHPKNLYRQAKAGTFEQDNLGDFRIVEMFDFEHRLYTAFEGLSFTGFMNYHERYNCSRYVDEALHIPCPKASFSLVDVIITPDGISTMGWLWRLGSKIDLKVLKEKYEQYRDPEFADPDAYKLLCVRGAAILEEFVKDLAEVLAKKHGALSLSEKLHEIFDSTNDTCFRTWLLAMPYRAKMISSLMDSLIESSSLQLGYLISSPEILCLSGPECAEHYTLDLPRDPSFAMAIFASQSSDYAFTADVIDPTRLKYKLISLPIDLPARRSIKTSIDGHVKLICGEWIYGIWFSDDFTMNRYTFPWQYFGDKKKYS